MDGLSRRGFLIGLSAAGILGALGIKPPGVTASTVASVPVVAPLSSGTWFDLNSPEAAQMWERAVHQAVIARSPLFDPEFGLVGNVGNNGECLLLEVS